VAGLRDLGALADADRLTGTLAEALLRAGEPAEAEALFKGLLDRLPSEAPERAALTELHAEAAKSLGRGPDGNVS
jgi:cytochrome c-type biogenesis protein CcmH/NrfG